MKKILCASLVLVMLLMAAVPAMAATPTDARALGEEYGQNMIDFSYWVQNPVQVQGRVDKNEYPFSRTVTKQIAANDTATSHLNEVTDWTEYYAFDHQYLYLAVRLCDPDFTYRMSGHNYSPSIFTFTVSVPTAGDLAATTERLEIPIEYFPQNHIYLKSPALVRTCTKYTFDTTTNQMTSTSITVSTNSDNSMDHSLVADVAGTYDEKTHYVVYELKLDMKALLAAFGKAYTKHIGVASTYERYQRYEYLGALYKVNPLGTIATYAPIDATTQALIRRAHDVNFINDWVPHMLNLPTSWNPSNPNPTPLLPPSGGGDVNPPAGGGDVTPPAGDDTVPPLNDETNEAEDQTTKAPETTKPAEEKKGCGSALGGAAMATVAVIGLGVDVLRRKRH